ncbi:MAG: FAD-dependent oxidoreductase [Chloroflexi bacterium]|nr:MAG: FAD-dependent oxidoreductase [Chloroflexota bacterium]
MPYHIRVNQNTCINCGICMDLCPVRCLDMTRPPISSAESNVPGLASPVPGDIAQQAWMMLFPVQVADCINCQVCVQECPTNAITIAKAAEKPSYAQRGPLSPLPQAAGWIPLNAYTRATPEEPGEAPWGEQPRWHVAERHASWQSWRTWLGERKEDLRAPCQAACPVGTNAGLYISLIAEGRYQEAADVAAEANPFPAICGRVCTAPCEAVCRRSEFDQPIAIRDLKRFAMDHATVVRHIQQPKLRHIEHIAIVGAGPTGLSAAYYLARRGYNVTVFDAMPVAGGMMAIGIPDYRLPRTELHRDIAAIRELGVVFRFNMALGLDIALEELQQSYDAVLLAVGAQRSQRLEMRGEAHLDGIIPATLFLKQYNLDPQTRLNGDVAVVGGGSTALDAARSALRAGASSVHVLYRRTRTEMPAQAEEVRAALDEGIQLHELVMPKSLLGTEDGSVQGILCWRMRLGEPDEKGRRRPIRIPGSDFAIRAQHVLVAVGEAPDPSFLPAETAIEVAPWGGLLINPTTLATGIPGVFAAGDVTYGPKSIIHAAEHGRKAAQSIHAYLSKCSVEQISEMPDDEWETVSASPPDGTITLDLRPTQREVMAYSPITTDRSVEAACGFNEEQALHEARRCLRCDLAYLCPTVRMVRDTATVAHK